MQYFTPFNYVAYPDFLDPTKVNIMKNITSRVIRKLSTVDDQTLYYLYTMNDHESIETVSNSLYGTPNYYWTIIVVNKLYDKFYDFTLSNTQLTDHIVGKYGSLSAAQNSFRYYIKASSYTNTIVEVDQTTYNNSTDPGKYSISYFDNELTINEDKRKVTVIHPKYINQFVSLFSTLANE